MFESKKLYARILEVLFFSNGNVCNKYRFKKFAAEYFESEIHIRTWTTSRYGAHPYRKFITPIQIGLLLPFITATITKGIIIWFAPLVFDIKRKIYKVGRRHDKLNSFLETTEKETGKIASFGILMNLIFALIFFLIGFKEFASLNIYFTFFNILPFSDLDGAKIYFSGNKILGILNAWKFLASIIFVATLLSLAFT